MFRKSDRTGPLLLFLGLSLVLSACGNSAASDLEPTPTPEYVHCGAQNLINAIHRANLDPDPSTLILDGSCDYTLTEAIDTRSVKSTIVHSGLPAITSDITIQGRSASIAIAPDPGEPPFGHFYIMKNALVDGSLNIYELTLTGGSREFGGSIINYQGDFFASDSNFSQNSAYPASDQVAAGGAIYSYSGRVRIINNSRLENNQVGETLSSGENNGGAIYSENSTLVVSNSFLSNNNAAGQGGAIFAYNDPNKPGGAVTVNESRLLNNYALANGGALSLNTLKEGVYIHKNEFEFNRSEENGGGIFFSDSIISGYDNTFDTNWAINGAAICSDLVEENQFSSYQSEFSIFRNNDAFRSGGAIVAKNIDLSVISGVFENNRAENCGAILTGHIPGEGFGLDPSARSNPTVQITDSLFTENSASGNYGGAMCHTKGDLIILGGRFGMNTSHVYGGALVIQDQSRLDGVEIYQNEASQGAGLFIGYPTGDDTFINNHDDGFVIRLYSSIIDYNAASFSGGGIFANHEGSLYIKKTTYHANSAPQMGGGIHLENGDTWISNSTLVRNEADQGGGIYAHGNMSTIPRLRIRYTTIYRNIAAESNSSNYRWGGGGINVAGNVTISESIIAKNSSFNCMIANGSTGTNYSAVDTYASDDTCDAIIESDPMLGNLTDHGGSTHTVDLKPDSPLIDILASCSGFIDDQRGISRPQGIACDPGAYEFNSSDPPPPPSMPGTSECDPFAGLAPELHMLGLPEDTMNLPVVVRVDGEFPGLDPDNMELSPLYEYNATLGDLRAYLCGPQGFPDRLICMFNLPDHAPGMALDFTLFLNDCEDPVYFLPLVSIPEGQSADGPDCHIDLGPGDCEAAGGHMSTGSPTTPPRCVCPN